ncbi:hypothetical protein Q5P01_001354 [Channa striata]|uniref:Apolipoprotein M n=1 Tax=Channa striata TaxID=64152 RepID=A0AA88NQS0_CHASR|nr:hypothetical protein Q5P01_001354 [Channa striata]
MKTWCVAVVLLSLSSVCQPAPLACDKLLKPVDKSPDLSGRWYLISMSSDNCMVPAVLNAFFWPSVAVDVTLTEPPNRYNSNFKFKMYGLCNEETEAFLHENNTLFDIKDNNVASDSKDVLLYTGCPDCLVTKGEDFINTFLLFSRRKTVTAAELMEFETQAKCLGWYKPQIFNTDHEYENCKTLDDDSDVDSADLSNRLYQRLRSSYTMPLSCITESIFSIPSSVSEWFQEQFSTLA